MPPDSAKEKRPQPNGEPRSGVPRVTKEKGGPSRPALAPRVLPRDDAVMHSERNTNPPISTMGGISRCDFGHNRKRTTLASRSLLLTSSNLRPISPYALLLLNGRPCSSSHLASRSGLHRHGVPALTQPSCFIGLGVCRSQSHPLPAHVGNALSGRRARWLNFQGASFGGWLHDNAGGKEKPRRTGHALRGGHRVGRRGPLVCRTLDATLGCFVFFGKSVRLRTHTNST